MLTEGGSKNLQVDVEEDSDMKIAGAPTKPAADDGELAAREFNEQKDSGNIEKAYALGDRFSELLFTTDALLEKNAEAKYANSFEVQANARVLFAFMVDIMLEHCCPGSITARTALNEFHKRVEERSAEVYHQIMDSAAFSLYLLCARDEKMACSCIGDTFADSCGLEHDRALASLGDRLYGTFYQICATEISKAEFIRL